MFMKEKEMKKKNWKWQADGGQGQVVGWKGKEKKTLEQETDVEAEFLLKVKALTNQQLNQYSNIYFNKIKKNIKIYEK